jgi:hypothetical protein
LSFTTRTWRGRDQGKELLGLLVERIVLLPKDGYLEAEVRGSLQGLLKLKSPRSGNQGLREITLVAGGGFGHYLPCSDFVTLTVVCLC